jgi:hypothetical protein
MANELVTGRNAKVWIGPAVTSSAADTLTELEALTGWVAIGNVERIGARGATSASVTGNVITENLTRKAKGVRNNGNAQVVCFTDDADAGQVAMRAAEATNFKYAFKISPNDRPGPSGTDSIQYFRGLVMSAEDSELTSDGLVRTTFGVEVDGEIFRVAAAA